jgi:hypothetical protein
VHEGALPAQEELILIDRSCVLFSAQRVKKPPVLANQRLFFSLISPRYFAALLRGFTSLRYLA